METDDANEVSDLTLLPPEPPTHPVGIYGWRKRCIYGFVLILMAIIIMNIALTVWILRILNISITGIDRIKINPNGIRIDKEVEFLQTLYANKVQSKKDQPLYVLSNKEVQLLSTTHNPENETVDSKLVVGKDNIEASCETFTVKNSDGDIMLQVNGDNNITLATRDAVYLGPVEFSASVSTPSVRSPLGETLTLAANLSEVMVCGMAGVNLVSEAGNVTIDASEEIRLESAKGHIILASQVSMTGLPKLPSSSSNLLSKSLPNSSSKSSSISLSKSSAKSTANTISNSPSYPSSNSSNSPSRLPRSDAASQSPSSSTIEHYQLCVCGKSGRLFVALSSQTCNDYSLEMC